METVTDPVLDEEYDLGEEQVAQFRGDGHILLRGVCPSVDRWRPLLHDATLRLSTENRPIHEREVNRQAFLQVINLWERAPEVRPFVLSRRFGAIATRLMGASGARLYHDQALFKEAGGGFTPYHQDQGFWPFDDVLTVTMWVALVDITPDMGPVEFVTGSHTRGHVDGQVGISEESERFWQRWREEEGLTTASYPEMAAGDATFHAGWLLHRAGPNTSGRMRAAMTVIYHPSDARVMDPLTHGSADLAKFLPGCGPGDLAASPLNPVVHP